MKEKIIKNQELILWKGKQNWPASGQVQQEDPNKQDENEKRRKKTPKKPDTTKYKKLYGTNMKKCNNLDDLEEMDRCLKHTNKQKLNQEEIYRSQLPQMRARICNFKVHERSQRSDGFIAKFNQIYENLYWSFSNSSKRLKKKEYS